ncbi:hypothetical protein [Desulfoferrobacter suflitae]|uniref:hypothetical protein n=1 Tax=Desulfoferrobacter suflitae TaxID=2865782 RepID=UPI002164BF02|nr:hypothetical protein [Desulfoferrobacter suflitae]MCK8604404.1 hypothetical protein [Desulfoferrobacter suflitae]
MIYCACDPDVSTPAFAVFNGIKLVTWKLFRGSPGKWLPKVRGVIEIWQPELLVIENQYLPASIDACRRFRSVSRLVSARAMITAAFILAGIDYEVVEPFAWQKSLGGSSLGREQLKAVSMLKASEIAGRPIDDHNVADSINIGYWWFTTNRFKRGAKRKKRHEAILPAR